MKIIKYWKELKSILLPNNLQVDLLNHLLQATNNDEALYDEYWLNSVIIIIDSTEDINLLAHNSINAFSQYFPNPYQEAIKRLLHYPEYIDVLNKDYFIALNVMDDEGSGLFLVFDKGLGQANSILHTLKGQQL